MTTSLTCPVCAATELSTHAEDRAIRAPDGTMVPYAAEYTSCASCDEEFYSKKQSRAASRSAASALRAQQGLLTPEEIIAIRSRYGVTQTELERVLQFGKKSVVRWESGAVTQSRSADSLLREVNNSPAMFSRLAANAGLALKQLPVAAPKNIPWARMWNLPTGAVVTMRAYTTRHSQGERGTSSQSSMSQTFRAVILSEPVDLVAFAPISRDHSRKNIRKPCVELV